ncbi:hypothetical protein [Psittacicella hinzii]|uniref:hypothetical protein n=1 Tax=Psittacicella hinzii TaxID=2028575 RepID=UPI001CA739F0|nr:hypothetical protein [Psittacicella hinzii]
MPVFFAELLGLYFAYEMVEPESFWGFVFILLLSLPITFIIVAVGMLVIALIGLLFNRG